MTLSKLSLRNARRQARDYLVYFVTVVIAAALIYAFNGLVFSDEIRNLSQMMEQLPLVIVWPALWRFASLAGLSPTPRGLCSPNVAGSWEPIFSLV